MRTWFAWIGGVLILGFVFAGLESLGQQFGLVAVIDLDEPIINSNRYYDEEVYSIMTPFGYWCMTLSFILAMTIGTAIDRGGWRGGKPENRLLAGVILAGITVYAVTATVLWGIIGPRPSDWPLIIGNLMELGIVVGVFFFSRRQYLDRLVDLDRRNTSTSI